MSPRRIDLSLAGAGVLIGALPPALDGRPGYAAVAAVLGALLAGARRHPTATWALVSAVLLGIAALGGTPPDSMAFSLYFLPGAHAFCAGLWEPLGRAVAAAAALVVSGSLLSWADSGPFLAFVVVAAWGAGRALRERDEMARRLAARARELDEERDVHAALSVRYERARIAAELHDIVAHAISVMVVQATAGQRLAARDPALAAQTFANLGEAARQAESDLGRLVALLAEKDAIGTAPDLSLVEQLVAHAAGSGLDVRLSLEGEREGLPAAVTEAAYRVVQEGLTNALRYAAGAPVEVVVRGDRERLDVRVENGPAGDEAALAGAGTGNGLRGLRERVGACGGLLEAGPLAGGGWRLAARLPARPAVAAPVVGRS